uniref:AlNc14C300G10369 protein n=1 Tax=Albugo laibachii Nc14 TaxID=890382 RepID=F0WVN2_9STRA|nr:AlNc14C300G10369 [Albugo laibachii Nc14]|eukprot:CCA25476.1 AlNc14C300G10369 [Albugo laibachii Nc14]
MGESSSGESYAMVIKDDASKYCLLEPCRAADAAACADAHLRWFSLFGECKNWVSDQGTHFLNAVINHMKRALGANYHFTTARRPWANGTVERLMRELVRCTRVLLNEWRLQPSDWCRLLPVVQLILNPSPSPSMHNVPPITAMTGLNAMKLKDRIVVQSDPIIVSSLKDVFRRQRAQLESLAVALNNMHKMTADAYRKRRQQRDVQSKKPNVHMANFDIGDYVLHVDVWTHTKSKLRMRWNGPAEITATVSN